MILLAPGHVAIEQLICRGKGGPPVWLILQLQPAAGSTKFEAVAGVDHLHACLCLLSTALQQALLSPKNVFVSMAAVAKSWDSLQQQPMIMQQCQLLFPTT